MESSPTAIVPAAGRSRRMGRPKLLLPFGEGTVLGATLAALAGGGARRIAVVARSDDRRLPEWLAGGAAEELGERLGRSRELPDLLIAFNPDPERGMLSSVLTSLDALGGDGSEAAALAPPGPLLVTPGDLPALAPDTVTAVLAALTDSEVPSPETGTSPALAVPLHGGRRGHPLGIAPRLVPEIPGLDLTVGLRQLLERHPQEVAEVPVDDPGCVRDVDTPEDYRELRQP